MDLNLDNSVACQTLNVGAIAQCLRRLARICRKSFTPSFSRIARASFKPAISASLFALRSAYGTVLPWHCGFNFSMYSRTVSSSPVADFLSVLKLWMVTERDLISDWLPLISASLEAFELCSPARAQHVLLHPP